MWKEISRHQGMKVNFNILLNTIKIFWGQEDVNNPNAENSQEGLRSQKL